jgi:hypothetical protein
MTDEAKTPREQTEFALLMTVATKKSANASDSDRKRY